jgi:pSer/pThr/pTyr-binding forkhead associated (FHA) protein
MKVMAAVWIRYRGVRVPIRRRTVLGRSPYSTLVVDGSTISRQHAILELRREGLVVTDAGSRNGTRVNGTLIQETQRVLHGDVIQLGHEQIVVEFGDHEAEAWDTPLTADFVELVAALRPRIPDLEGDSSGSIPTLEIPPAVLTLPSPEGAEPELGSEVDPVPNGRERRQ